MSHWHQLLVLSKLIQLSKSSQQQLQMRLSTSVNCRRSTRNKQLTLRHLLKLQLRLQSRYHLSRRKPSMRQVQREFMNPSLQQRWPTLTVSLKREGKPSRSLSWSWKACQLRCSAKARALTNSQWTPEFCANRSKLKLMLAPTLLIWMSSRGGKRIRVLSLALLWPLTRRS